MRLTLRLLALSLLLSTLTAAQNIEFDRSRARKMLELTSKHIEKSFHDPTLRGIDWKSATTEAEQRIQNAKSAGEMFGAIFMLVNRLEDSHTVFLPPQRNNQAFFGFEAKAYGDKVYVYKLKKGGAAEKAGLKLGDYLMGVNGVAVDRGNVDTVFLILRALRPVGVMELDVVREGKPIHLSVRADVKKRPKELDLTEGRNVFELIRELEDEEEKFYYSKIEGGIGYMQLPSFVHSDLPGLVNKVKDSKAMIVDLRGNPGGVIDYMEHFIGCFEADAVTVAELLGRKKGEYIKAKPHKPNFAGPMFILVDSQTGSAAEVVARHFQRNKRAVIIGDHTSGRVTAARMYTEALGTDSVVPFGVQVAIGRVLFPGNEELEKKGVVPDEKCVPTGETLASGGDLCYGVAVTMARKALGLAAVPEEKSKSE